MLRLKAVFVILIIVIIFLLGLLFLGRNRIHSTNTVTITVTSSPSIANQSATLTPVADSPKQATPTVTKVTEIPSLVSKAASPAP